MQPYHRPGSVDLSSFRSGYNTTAVHAGFVEGKGTMAELCLISKNSCLLVLISFQKKVAYSSISITLINRHGIIQVILTLLTFLLSCYYYYYYYYYYYGSLNE
jgi:hypothetical protein